MNSRKGFTLIELLVVIAIIAILAAILFPVFAKARASARTSTCQSNLNQIGKAIKSYVTDWRETYPTNRNIAAGMMLVPHIPLSPSGTNPATGEPYIFYYGPNWVEALYPYVERVGKPGDNQTVWICPSARDSAFSATAANTYAMNYNLLEQSEGQISSPANVMLIREMDSRFGSICRPRNQSSGSTPTPICPFLNSTDPDMGSTVCKFKLHADGSHILFADGHVKLFPITMMDNSQIKYDGQQWWNSLVPNKKVIAITP